MFRFLIVAMAAWEMGVFNRRDIRHSGVGSTAVNIFSIIFGLGFAYWLSGGQMAGNTRDVNALPEIYAQWAIIGMAIGVLIGGAAQFLIQVPLMLKIGFRFYPVISFTDPGVLQVARLMAPASWVFRRANQSFIDVFLLSATKAGNRAPYASPDAVLSGFGSPSHGGDSGAFEACREENSSNSHHAFRRDSLVVLYFASACG